MKKLTKMMAVLLTVVFIGLAAGGAYAEMTQTKCPVMGYKPNEKLYTDYKGKRIYFCCPACPDEFKKDPEKYMKKLEDMGQVLEDAPEKK